MAKKLTNAQKRCQDCPSLITKNGQWCCDECFGQLCEEIDDCPEGVTLEQIEELDAKAKANKIQHQAKSTTPKERAPRERKPDEEKEKIIASLSEFLANQTEFTAENVKITNVSKVVEFDIGGNHYKLDLIKQRPPKKN